MNNGSAYTRIFIIGDQHVSSPAINVGKHASASAPVQLDHDLSAGFYRDTLPLSCPGADEAIIVKGISILDEADILTFCSKQRD
jgi:hypothetical protein